MENHDNIITFVEVKDGRNQLKPMKEKKPKNTWKRARPSSSTTSSDNTELVLQLQPSKTSTYRLDSEFMGDVHSAASTLITFCLEQPDQSQQRRNVYDLLNACERLVCLLYGIDHNDVNDVRCQLFSTKGIQSHFLQQRVYYTNIYCMPIIKLASGEKHWKD